MRNTKRFDLNIYEVQVPAKHNQDSNRIRQLASQKWNEICAENNSQLIKLFRKINPEIAKGYDRHFISGKYWQMLDVLDGNFFLRNRNLSKGQSHMQREAYQDRVFLEGIFSDTLQIGWDLAINAGLLSELMPVTRNRGAAYLLKKIVWDRDSTFYPTVTESFETKLVNEAFWQIATDICAVSGYTDDMGVLERVLTTSFPRLNPCFARDQLLRWKSYSGSRARGSEGEKIQAGPLVVGRDGEESFQGLSSRAIINYGQFLSQLGTVASQRELEPFKGAYLNALDCRDDNGNYYFSHKERERLPLLIGM